MANVPFSAHHFCTAATSIQKTFRGYQLRKLLSQSLVDFDTISREIDGQIRQKVADYEFLRVDLSY